MRIGIISNSDFFIPLAYTLAMQKLQVYIFYVHSQDNFVNQKVKGFVNQFHIPFIEEKITEDDLYDWLLQNQFDTCFVMGYPLLIDLRKLKKSTTSLFNIHFGPLPSFRGPVPVFWQLKKGVKKLGLSIHQVSQKFDDGPLVWSKETDNQPHYNYQAVHEIFSQLCIEGVIYILKMLMNKLPIPSSVKPTVKSSYYKRPGLNEVLINWNNMSAEEICNLVRACNSWNKGALSIYKGNELKLLDARIIDLQKKKEDELTPGMIIIQEDRLYVNCISNQFISINTVYYKDSFIPSWQCKQWGINSGDKLG